MTGPIAIATHRHNQFLPQPGWLHCTCQSTASKAFVYFKLAIVSLRMLHRADCSAYCASAAMSVEREGSGPQLKCLQRAQAKLETISTCYERRVSRSDVETWVLPALKQAFERNFNDQQQQTSEDDTVAAIEAFALALASMAAKYDNEVSLLSSDGKMALGDFLLREEYRPAHCSLACDPKVRCHTQRGPNQPRETYKATCCTHGLLGCIKRSVSRWTVCTDMSLSPHAVHR